MTFQPSPQQQLIFSAISVGDHNICVDAKAGSGKTTTIVKGMAYIPKLDYGMSPDAVFLAFNKGIADTLKSLCPRGVLCSTFHALGLRTGKESNIFENRFVVDAAKCRKILYDYHEYDNDDFKNILRLVSLLKGGQAVNYEDINTDMLIELYNLDFVEPKRAVKMALKVLVKSDEQRDIIDFDDMLHMPVRFNARFQPRDWIFVDEAQDLNNIQHEIIARMCKHDRTYTAVKQGNGVQIDPEADWGTTTRIVAVGDPHQAIYGFRGALSDSMQQLIDRFNMRTYPLSVSYRCPKAVVREARKYLLS